MADVTKVDLFDIYTYFLTGVVILSLLVYVYSGLLDRIEQLGTILQLSLIIIAYTIGYLLTLPASLLESKLSNYIYGKQGKYYNLFLTLGTYFSVEEFAPAIIWLSEVIETPVEYTHKADISSQGFSKALSKFDVDSYLENYINILNGLKTQIRNEIIDMDVRTGRSIDPENPLVGPSIANILHQKAPNNQTTNQEDTLDDISIDTLDLIGVSLPEISYNGKKINVYNLELDKDIETVICVAEAEIEPGTWVDIFSWDNKKQLLNLLANIGKYKRIVKDYATLQYAFCISFMYRDYLSEANQAFSSHFQKQIATMSFFLNLSVIFLITCLFFASIIISHIINLALVFLEWKISVTYPVFGFGFLSAFIHCLLFLTASFLSHKIRKILYLQSVWLLGIEFLSKNKELDLNPGIY